MTDEEREDLNTFRHDLIKRARWWQWKAETLEKENEQLKAENAAMRKQISEMLTPLCTLGDKLYHYELSFGEGFDENGKVIHTSSMNTIETEVTRDNIWHMCDLVQNKRAFFSKEALAASFKERFQKGREQFVKEIKDDKRRTDRIVSKKAFNRQDVGRGEL